MFLNMTVRTLNETLKKDRSEREKIVCTFFLFICAISVDFFLFENFHSLLFCLISSNNVFFTESFKKHFLFMFEQMINLMIIYHLLIISQLFMKIGYQLKMIKTNYREHLIYLIQNKNQNQYLMILYIYLKILIGQKKKSN